MQLERQILDRIHIRDLELRCIIGFNSWEREKKQEVVINLTLHTDLSKAAASDRKEDTVDYKIIKDQVVELVENSSFDLIERMADAIAHQCLSNPAIARVDIIVDKPGALRFARSVAVELTRTNKSK